ncbi:unnamed protein product [Phaedon cochleariae]|uniref:Fibronectin type III domain-containing protein n=1 Tax=Phaedon cochleariae TaxID=80249 RepID=A0A9P0DRA2_PHACE|nr:unnamed protein product [Phaedon cochleariae]
MCRLTSADFDDFSSDEPATSYTCHVERGDVATSHTCHTCCVERGDVATSHTCCGDSGDVAMPHACCVERDVATSHTCCVERGYVATSSRCLLYSASGTVTHKRHVFNTTPKEYQRYSATPTTSHVDHPTATAHDSLSNLYHPHLPSHLLQIHAQPPRKPRPRMNSAIFVSSAGPGLDPKEFFRRHGSVSRLCRKARSVDNISLEEKFMEGKRFGVPQLSVSGPSPPEDDEREEEEEEEEGEGRGERVTLMREDE